MPIQTDTGNAPNLDSFNRLKNACNTFVPAYLPARENLQLPALEAQYTSCNLAQKAVNDKKVLYSREVADRTALYATVQPLTTRCLAILRASTALEQIIKGATGVANKVRGVDTRKDPSNGTPEEASAGPEANGSAAATEMTPEEKRYSVSQMSYVMQAENFGKFIAILKQEPAYQPGSDDLKIPALEALHTQLTSANTTVENAYFAYKAALGNRNKLFYDTNSGLVAIALNVKEYVKGEYGISSDAYGLIKSIPFRRLDN